ncbi:MAG TPA: type II secretion system protein [Tepidisphaeraceae bacterium]|jgi:prepilin-type N-terminal cleavage/methylation domain-containing protein|nr:type II secretion system protein [Tepidisphaeraceae bacterium]
MQHCTRRGFTLVELLVVIGIIAVLVGILIPVVGRSRESARTAQCLSNQRNIFTSLKAFANDNNELFPGAGGFVLPPTPGSPPTGGGPLGFGLNGPPAPSAGLVRGATTFASVGQAIGANDQYPQDALEQSTRSALIIRGYLPTSKIFHCPSRDADPYIGVDGTQPLVIFHYVFNQYFVGDVGCDPTTYLPMWSGTTPVPAQFVSTKAVGGANFQKNYSARIPVTWTHSKSPQACVIITENQTLDLNSSNYTDSDPQNMLPLPKLPDGSQPLDRIACMPIHSRRPNKHDDYSRITHYDNVNCTYLDGHSETVFVDTTAAPAPSNGVGSKYFTVESDSAGLK